MEPSRELDALVAERVMGWTLQCADGWYGWMDAAGNNLDGYVWINREDAVRYIPAYSTDIADAWQVVEAMRGRGFAFNLCCWTLEEVEQSNLHDRVWSAEFYQSRYYRGDALTVPHTICLAALAAVEEQP